MNIREKAFQGIGYFALILCLILGQSVFALPEPDQVDQSVSPGEYRGPVSNFDEVNCDCMWDYQAMRISGSGGHGGRGTTIWPSGTYGGNYGEMSFIQNCGNLLNTVYAFCFDLDHGIESANYGVNIDSAVITDACSEAQLQALAYLLAWNEPVNAFDDDILQLAMWKLATDQNPASSTFGTPFFCIAAPNAFYPNLTYPYINTVYSTNPAYNNAANALVSVALDGNVLMGCDVSLGGDTLLTWFDPAEVGPTESTVTIHVCVVRGPNAVAVGNTDLEGIRLLTTYTIGLGAPVNDVLYTDASGCASFTVTQSIHNDSYDDVAVEFCSHSAWPVNVIPCEPINKQDLVFGEPDTCCWRLDVPGDNWFPVELMSFRALNSHDGVDLMWTTASETSVAYWEIERSNSESDDFSLLAKLEAQNTPTGGHYTYFDRLGINGNSYNYRLVNVDLDGSRTVHPEIQSASYGQLGAVDAHEYTLADAYPNPFNPSTSIRYSIPEAGLVTIKVYDVSGREVAELVNGRQEAGPHNVTFDGTHLSSGTYFYRMTAADFSMTKRIMLLK
jgi:hypothetical protein